MSNNEYSYSTSTTRKAPFAYCHMTATMLSLSHDNDERRCNDGGRITTIPQSAWVEPIHTQERAERKEGIPLCPKVALWRCLPRPACKGGGDHRRVCDQATRKSLVKNKATQHRWQTTTNKFTAVRLFLTDSAPEGTALRRRYPVVIIANTFKRCQGYMAKGVCVERVCVPMKNPVCSLCGKSNYPPTKRTNIKGEKALDVCSPCNYRIQKAISRHNTRARQKGLIASLTSAQWIAILQDSEGYCHYCKVYLWPISLTPDHVIPIGKGGANSADNIVAACGHCNNGKNAKSSEEWLGEIQNGYYQRPGTTYIWRGQRTES